MNKTQFTMTRKTHTLLAGSHTEELIGMECRFTHSWADDGKHVTFYKNNMCSFSSRVMWHNFIAIVKTQLLKTGSFTQLER